MSEPSVTEADVRHVATLARVDVEDSDIQTLCEDFAEILAYFDRLEEVPERSQGAESEDVLRADEVRPSLPAEEALRNAPDTEDGYFKGPPVS